MRYGILLLAAMGLTLGSLGQRPPQPIPIPNWRESSTLIRKVQPVYPEKAKKAGVQGTVVLDVVISKDGTVETAQAAKGNDPELVAAATDAVRQWVWKPFLINGKAVSVRTKVTVNFVLDVPKNRPEARPKP